jgi:hypothetical protein
MAPQDAPNPKEAEEPEEATPEEATPEEAEHQKRIDREKNHGGLGEDVKAGR